MASRDSPADHLRGTMRKLTLLVAILLAASFAIADAAPKKKKSAEPEDLNANSKKLLWDGLPLVMPSAVMYYMLYQKQVEREKAEKAQVTRVSARRKNR
jgi:H+/gluconate symporter-like permease